MVGTILELLVGGGAGGILGLFGAWMTKREERRVMELKLAHEEKMGELQLKEQLGEQTHELAMADKQMEKAEVEAQVKIDEATIKGWATTLSDEMSKSTLGAMVKGAIRPTLTLYLLGVTTWLTANLWILVEGLDKIEGAELLQLLKLIILQLLFLTVTTTTWWFGARASSQPAIALPGWGKKG